MLTDLSVFLVRAKTEKVSRIAVAAAADIHVLEAVRDAAEAGIAEAVLFGPKGEVEAMAAKVGMDSRKIEIVDVTDPNEAAARAVGYIREGGAQILMKGLVATGVLLKAVLDKENGLRTGMLLSHAGLFQSPYYPKIFAVTDAGMNVAPNFEEKTGILHNAVEMFHRIGESNPKVAVMAAVETVNPKMEPTVHAAMLTQMNRRGQIRGCIVDGPLALDNAVSRDAAEHKGIAGDVAGDADIILVPDIESGNLLYKALNFLGGAVAAGVILGAKAPIVLTSRADSEKSKLYSIALAATIGVKP